jgi:hypothetical protein
MPLNAYQLCSSPSAPLRCCCSVCSGKPQQQWQQQSDRMSCTCVLLAADTVSAITHAFTPLPASISPLSDPTLSLLQTLACLQHLYTSAGAAHSTGSGRVVG